MNPNQDPYEHNNICNLIIMIVKADAKLIFNKLSIYL